MSVAADHLDYKGYGGMPTTWVTAGEAKGLLTMPPDRERIEVGTVSIQLGDDGRASATGYEIVMNPVGMTTSKVPVGPTKIYLGCEVEAETREEALASAHPIMEEALDLVALASGAAVGPVRVVRVIEKIEPPGTAKVLIAGHLLTAPVTSWNAKHDAMLPRAAEAVERLLGKDREHFRDGLRWERSACVEDDPKVHYLFLWYAVESLSRMSFVRVQERTRECVNCRKRLRCALCQWEQTFVPEVRTQQLLVDTLGLWSKKEHKSGWRLRSKLAHGASGLAPNEEEEANRLIVPMHKTLRDVFQAALATAGVEPGTPGGAGDAAGHQPPGTS